MTNVARRVYSAEELHRLRASSSAPRLHEAIEEHDQEDADLVKEHVLRGSKSFAVRSFRSRAPLSSLRFASGGFNNENRLSLPTDSTNASQPTLPSNAPSVDPPFGQVATKGPIWRPSLPFDGSNIDPCGMATKGPIWRQGAYRLRPSPTPSIRRKRVEAIIKQHGSPQHVRVTAGGRVVPSEQSPLCHPRFGWSAVKLNGGLIKFAPNYPVGKAHQWIEATQATQDGFVAQDVDGRLCQIVNGSILPLAEVDGALRLYMPAPNLNVTQRGPSQGLDNGNLAAADTTITTNGDLNTAQASALMAPQPSMSAQTNALELEYSKLERELKDLDKSEVLHGRTIGNAAKEALVAKRRELIVNMDNVRRALKSIKQSHQQLGVREASNHGQHRQSVSPRANRLPVFLQQPCHEGNIAAPQQQPPHPFGHPFFGVASPPLFHAAFDFPPLPAHGPTFVAQQYQAPSPGVFMQPPPFDGSVGIPFTIYQDPAPTSPPNTQNPRPAPMSPASVQSMGNEMPQNDGSRSIANLRVASPRQSRALAIKDPDTRQLANVKSTLNPMSPVYKPGGRLCILDEQGHSQGARSVRGRVPTPLNILGNVSHNANSTHGGEHTRTPRDKKAVVDSSSVSSIRTADFFPHNTRDFSLRKHEYPLPNGSDKENADPETHVQTPGHSPITPKCELHNTNWNPDIPDGAFVNFNTPKTGNCTAPTAPPGTPIQQVANHTHPQLQVKLDNTDWERHDSSHDVDHIALPNRETHILSPKSKRQEWQFVEEYPAEFSSEVPSSSTKIDECRDELCVTTSPMRQPEDVSNKSRSWLEGHQAGLQRRAVGAHRIGEYLDGYCAGLLKSQPAVASNNEPSTGSPTQPLSRRPSASQVAASSNAARRPSVNVRPPLETSTRSMDTLKQVVFAPQNENAILTPLPDGLLANDHPYNLGTWQRQHEHHASHRGDGLAGFPFPERSSSLVSDLNHLADASNEKRHGQMLSTSSIGPTGDQSGKHPARRSSYTPRSPAISGQSPLPEGNVPGGGARISSITSLNAHISHQKPSGQRVFSPFEWKSTSSVAHAANLATGFFSNTQHDGTRSESLPADSPKAGLLPNAATMAGARPDARDAGGESRFKEASLDGLSDPASPRPLSLSMSPPLSPRSLNPTRMKNKAPGQRKESPGKVPSPAKAKFEHIASKVGIKPSMERKDSEQEALATSPGKRRWRDVWRGSRKDGNNDNEGS